MTASAALDMQAAHRRFSAECFNKTWELLDRPSRSSEEDQKLLLLAASSLWHWTERVDCTARHKSVGYWLLSRVHAVQQHGPAAQDAARLSLEYAAAEPPFYLAYAEEALARAEYVLGNQKQCGEHLAEARKYLSQVTDADEQKMLEADLNQLDQLAGTT